MEKLLLWLLAIAWFIMPFTGHAEIARHLDEELDRGRLVVESSPAGEAAQNQIRFRFASRVTARYFQGMQTAIKGNL